MLPPTVIPLEMETGNRQKAVPPPHKSDRPEPELHTPMKTNPSLLRHLAVAAALLLPAATPTLFAQTTATTDPVGFITLTAAGGGTVASPKLTLLSPTLMQPISWQGAITGVSTNTTGSTTITVSGVQWTTDQFNGAAGAYYLEIISTTTPGHSGVMGQITSTTAGTTNSSLTTTENLFTFAAIGDTIRIRKDLTLADVFGATNSAGLLASSGDASTADEILLYNGAASVSYFYYTGSPGFPAGWYNSTTFDPAGTVVLAPHQGVVIKKKTTGGVTFTSNGAVKTGNTLFPVVNGLNVLGTVSAQGLTLATSGLYTGDANTGVKPSSGDASTADELVLYPSGSPVSYFYYTGSPGFPAGWYNSTTFDPADAVSIAPGTAFVLNRKGGVAFNWTLPSPSSF